MKPMRWRVVTLAVAAIALLLAAGVKASVDVMLSRDPPPAQRATGVAPGSRLAQMPLFETPAAGQAKAGDTIAIFYSGDNGWAKVDRRVSADLAAAGTPVVGVDALRYFMRERTPSEASADLAAIIDHYTRLWGRSRVLLVGYSFGADSLPVIVEGLPPQTRARVRLVALLGPGEKAELVFRPTSWINLYWPGAVSVSGALATLKDVPSVCIYGAQDPVSACPRFPAGLIALAPVPGGHRYKGQYQAITSIILRAAGLVGAAGLRG